MTLLRDSLAFILLFAVTAPGASLAREYNPPRHSQSAYFDVLADLTRASSIEPAVSHGSEGLTLGVGIAQHATSQSMPRHELVYADSGDRDLLVSQIHILKGTPLPIDIGILYSTVETRLFSVMALYAQWSLYEELHMPALALRGSYGRLLDVDSTAFQTVTTEIQASYAFFNFFTVFGGFGGGFHAGSYQVTLDPAHALFELEDSGRPVNQNWLSSSYKIGVQIALGTPLAKIAGEVQSSAHRRVFAASLSLGI